MIGELIGGGVSLLGSLFGGGKKKPQPIFSPESQDIMFGDLMSQLGNWGSPVPAMQMQNYPKFRKRMEENYGPMAEQVFNPYGMDLSSSANPQPGRGMFGGQGVPARFGYGGGNMGGYNAGYGGAIR